MQKNFNGSRKEHVKKVAATFAALIMVLTAMSTMVTFFAAPVGAEEVITANVWTTDEFGAPKDDFSPGEVVYIHGKGFLGDTDVSITLTRPPDEDFPDGITDTAPGGRFPPSLPHTDGDGNFEGNRTGMRYGCCHERD